MDYGEYRKLKILINVYLETGNRQALADIQKIIGTVSGCRENIMRDLIREDVRYIQVFSTYDQIKYVGRLVNQIEHNKFIAFGVCKMLMYVSDEAFEQILSSTSNVALERIMTASMSEISVWRELTERRKRL